MTFWNSSFEPFKQNSPSLKDFVVRGETVKVGTFFLEDSRPNIVDHIN